MVKPVADAHGVEFKDLWFSPLYDRLRAAALDLEANGGELLADGSPIYTERCANCDNHDVNAIAYEALDHAGLWPFMDREPPRGRGEG